MRIVILRINESINILGNKKKMASSCKIIFFLFQLIAFDQTWV